jgi:hypothetical protein
LKNPIAYVNYVGKTSRRMRAPITAERRFCIKDVDWSGSADSRLEAA